MELYPARSLYQRYLRNSFSHDFSTAIPDVAKRITLEHMENALYFAEAWDSFLDIGGGSGHYSMALASLFRKGTIVELADFPEHALLANKFPNLSLFSQPIEKYEGGGKFDFILLADIYEHIPNVHAFVQKIAGLQNYGGVIYVMTPNPVVCGPAPESGIHHTRHEFGHIKHYTHQEVSNSFKKYGYEPVMLAYEEGPFRQEVKRIVKGLSRRDQSWRNRVWYRYFLRPFFLAASLTLSKILGMLVYAAERRNNTNEFYGMTECLTYKKISLS
jgi:2-polyprenyl-3-methyl-5-hydroxy-6-metoxy-1,4-benzoquinol methylase